ncbi:DNA clamp loader protein [Fragilaria crotonensis]|nr:DNA clamp loader protein [Fragilaria crotonensis]
MLKTLQLHNGSTILAVSHLNVEFVTPQLLRDDEIFERRSNEQADDSHVLQLETEKSMETPKTVQVSTDDCDGNLLALEELSQLAYKLERQSDVTWVEHSMYGIPWLGGASRGFASHFVEGLSTSSDPTTTSKLCRDNNAKPPPIERILLNGWNDHECFFGNSDVYFTNPGHRDRQLYSHIARFGRQGSPTTSIQSPDTEDVDDMEQEDIQTKHFPCQLDEDSFLMRETWLAELPSTVIRLLGDSPGEHQLTNSIHCKRRKRKMRVTNAFLNQLWHDANACLVFARGVGRDVDSEEPYDERIFLDYGPILSQICMYEAAAICLSDAPSDDTQSSSRRTTRRSKERMHAHHFMKVNQGLYEEDCREMGRNMAACLLRY